MREPRERLCFNPQSSARTLRNAFVPHDFHGDTTGRCKLHRFKNRTHSAESDQSIDTTTTDHTPTK
jgi:hypothetical protein